MIRATDIHSLSEFQRNAKAFIDRVRTTKSPIAVTINGRAEVVSQDAETYQAMVDELARAHLAKALHEGEEDISLGQVFDADFVLRELMARYDVPD